MYSNGRIGELEFLCEILCGVIVFLSLIIIAHILN